MTRSNCRRSTGSVISAASLLRPNGCTQPNRPYRSGSRSGAKFRHRALTAACARSARPRRAWSFGLCRAADGADDRDAATACGPWRPDGNSSAWCDRDGRRHVALELLPTSMNGIRASPSSSSSMSRSPTRASSSTANSISPSCRVPRRSSITSRSASFSLHGWRARSLKFQIDV